MNVIFGVVTTIFAIAAILGIAVMVFSVWGVILTATAQMDGEDIGIKDYLEDVAVFLLGTIILVFGLKSAVQVRNGISLPLIGIVVVVLFCIVVGIFYKRRTISAVEEEKPKLEIWRRRSIWVTMLVTVIAVLAITFLPLIAGGSHPDKNFTKNASEVKAAESDLVENSAATEEFESSFVPVDLNGMTEDEWLKENWGKYLDLPQIYESMSPQDEKRLAQTEDKYDLPLEFKYEKDLSKEEEAKGETYESIFGNVYSSVQLAEGWGMHPEMLEALPKLKSFLDVIDSAYSEYRDETTREVVKKGTEGARRMGAEYFLTENSKEEVVHIKEFQEFTAAMAEVIKHSEYRGVQKRQTKIIFGLPYKGQDDNSLRRAIARTKPEEQVTREVLVFITTLPDGSQLEWGLAKWSKDYCEFPEPSTGGGTTTTTTTVERNTPNTVEEEPPAGDNPPSAPSNPGNPSTPVTPNKPVEPNTPVEPNPDTKQTGETERVDVVGNAITNGGNQEANASDGTPIQENTETDYSASQEPAVDTTITNPIISTPNGTSSTGTGTGQNVGASDENGGQTINKDLPAGGDGKDEYVEQNWDTSNSATNQAKSLSSSSSENSSSQQSSPPSGEQVSNLSENTAAIGIPDAD